MKVVFYAKLSQLRIGILETKGLSEMKKILNVYKPKGLTPVQLISAVRKVYPEYSEATLSFAGRLDPMAEGVMLLLVGEENKNRQPYLGLDKEYEFEVLFGFATDTYDPLGLVVAEALPPLHLEQRLSDELPKYLGLIEQKYPQYSSKPVLDKALFAWAQEGRIGEIDIPSAKRHIYQIVQKSAVSVTADQLLRRIVQSVNRAQGNFRQTGIIERWREVLLGKQEVAYPVVTLQAVVSSGTYVRGISDDLGRRLGSLAIALGIKRTRVGSFTEFESLRI